MIKAVGFDLGETLVHYKGIPMTWQSMFRSALEKVAEACDCEATEEKLDKGEQVLTHYNTRVNPRIEEISSELILGEILQNWGLSPQKNIEEAQDAFFFYFQRNSQVYDDTDSILQYLKTINIQIGILTDVPYGMTSKYVRRDISSINQYIDTLVTSVEVGFRKPDPRGYIELATRLDTLPEHCIFVGNEPKDIQGANGAGMSSIFIDRQDTENSYGEKVKITSLLDLKELITN